MYGDTPLHDACREHQGEVTERLIQLGSQLDARNMELKTPLHVASYYGNPEVAQHLIDSDAAISPTDLEGHVRIMQLMTIFVMHDFMTMINHTDTFAPRLIVGHCRRSQDSLKSWGVDNA